MWILIILFLVLLYLVIKFYYNKKLYNEEKEILIILKNKINNKQIEEGYSPYSKDYTDNREYYLLNLLKKLLNIKTINDLDPNNVLKDLFCLSKDSYSKDISKVVYTTNGLVCPKIYSLYLHLYHLIRMNNSMNERRTEEVLSSIFLKSHFFEDEIIDALLEMSISSYLELFTFEITTEYSKVPTWCAVELERSGSGCGVTRKRNN